MVSGMASGRCLLSCKETYQCTRHQSKPDISCGDSCFDVEEKQLKMNPGIC